jgi:hypothetical protein
MHERYLATAIPLVVLAGFLDRRLLIVGIGISITFALSILAVGINFWKPWGDMEPTSQFFDPVRLLIIVNRIFCSALNLALFLWMTARLRHLLATSPDEDAAQQTENNSTASPRANH